MTREKNFRVSLEAQLSAGTGFTLVHARSTNELAPSELPSFSISLDKAVTGLYDLYGVPTAGQQDFYVRLFYSTPQLSYYTAINDRSDYVQAIEDLLNGGFSLPAVSPGDHSRIDSVTLTTIEAPTTSKLDTRHMITFKGTYHWVAI